jgi:fused signal recognition particle receptor
VITYVLIVAATLVVVAIIGRRVVRRRSQRVLSAPARTPLPSILVEEATARPDLVAVDDSLSGRLGASRGVFDRVRLSSGRGSLTTEQLELVEEVLLRSDVGVTTTQQILEYLQTNGAPDGLVAALRSQLVALLEAGDRSLNAAAEDGRVAVWLFVGVNGVGKTTTIGKVASAQVANGRSVVLAAGDTFRAAAADQLAMWAERTGADIVRGSEGSDPGAVIHDAIGRAHARGANLVLADTAGRRHTSTNLLEELSKVRRVADRTPGQVLETILVLDATTGQNAVSQAREFLAAANVTGLALTKLDGTARGGIVVALAQEFGLPVKLVGVGEGVADLRPFDPVEFVDALLEA